MSIDVSLVTVDTAPLRQREIARHLTEVDPNQLAALDTDENAYWDHLYDNTLSPSAPTVSVADGAGGGDADITFVENGPDSDTHVAYYLTPSTGSEDATTIVSTGTLIAPAPTTSPHTGAVGAGDVAVVMAGVNEAGQGPWSAPAYATIT
jgi:hypothetical protein